MVEVFLYAIGIMYTPGPANLLGLNAGLNHKFKESIGYFVGVGSAMFILFLLFGYTGNMIIKKEFLLYISLFGGGYILYLAVKVFIAKVDLNEPQEVKTLTFKDGLFLQLLNPKGTLATLPIATIYFPAYQITDGSIFFMSLFLCILAIGAPGSYSFLGEYFSKLIHNERVIKIVNKVMAILLIYVAFSILKDHVYLVIVGVNEY